MILVMANSGLTLAISRRVLSCEMGAAGTTVTGDEGGHRKSGVEEKDLFEYELQYHNVSKKSAI